MCPSVYLTLVTAFRYVSIKPFIYYFIFLHRNYCLFTYFSEVLNIITFYELKANM